MRSTPLLLLTLLACNGDKEDLAALDEGTVLTEELGTFSTDTGGLTGEIPFNIPAEAKSALVWCGEFGTGLLGTAWEIKDGAGASWYTNELHESYQQSAMFVDAHDDIVPVLMPVSPDHDISAGTWSANIWIAAGGSTVKVDCSAVYGVEAAPTNGLLDIDAVFVGLSDLDASSAEDDADFQAVLSGVDDLWGQAGVKLDGITYADFAGDASKYSVLDISADDTTEYNDLLATASLSRPRAVTIFFVEEINLDGDTILGKAAGPPGLATVSGTSKSGMVVTMADLRSDPDRVAQIIAHEAAHFIGLFHTSEKDGSKHDPLADTPTCAATADVNSDGLVSPDECSGKGGDYLMFWAPPSSSPNTMSSDQAWVMKHNPVIR